MVPRLVRDTFVDVNIMMGLEGEERLRGMGHTTHQIKNAPYRAVFVWCNENTHYARSLARSLDRLDVTIERPQWLIRQSEQRFRGINVVIDHAFYECYPNYEIRSHL